MGLSLNKFPYKGDNEFDLNFAMGYASKGDVTAYVSRDVPVSVQFEWLTDSRVKIVGHDIQPGEELVFARTVSKLSLPVDLTQPGASTREALELNSKHAMYAFHELLDGRFSGFTELDDAVVSSIEAAVRTALQNFIIGVTQAVEVSLKPSLTEQEVLWFTSGRLSFSEIDPQVFVLTPPSSSIEVLVSSASRVEFGFIVDTSGTVAVTTPVPSGAIPAGPITVSVVGGNYSSGAEIGIVLTGTSSSLIDFDAEVLDYTAIFEGAFNERQ